VATVKRDGRKRKQLQLGKVRYEIQISPTGADGFCRATWFCSECAENGTLSPVGMDVTELIREAEIGVRVHHTLYHGGDWTPRKPR
jgi:hypothetical protein